MIYTSKEALSCPIYESKHFKNWIKLSIVLVPLVISVIVPILFPKLTPVITIDNGQIQGRIAYSRDGREYYQFLSIPYAEPPLGPLRFVPPVPVKPWKGIKSTQMWPPLCIQFESIVTEDVYGQEDCLFINIFSQAFKNGNQKLKPVLLHIHGGGFLFGGSVAYGPDYFIDEDLVIVTFGYRLGPFGFLNFQHDSQIDGVDLPRGNMGMKDQLLVLKWVQQNIAQFGGDPEKVTIFGESAGATSVHLHVLSLQSRGLFYRAFSQSGTAFSSIGFTTQPRKIAESYAKGWDCPLKNNSELLSCLQNYDPREMVKIQLCSTDPTIPKDNISPSVEHVVREDTFLSKLPLEIMESGNVAKVPYILGVNSGDGGLRTGQFERLTHPLPLLKSNFSKTLGRSILFDRFPNAVADLVLQFYFGNSSNFQNLDTQDLLQKLNLIHSDVFFNEPIQRAAIGHAKSGAPTYLFYYDYKPKMLPGCYSALKGGFAPGDWLPTPIKLFLIFSFDWINEHVFRGNGAHEFGVAHGEEIIQFWNIFGITKWVSWWELEFSKSLVKMVADFARGTSEIEFKGTKWSSINLAVGNVSDEQPLPYMLLDDSKVGELIDEPFSERMQFWNSVGIKTLN